MPGCRCAAIASTAETMYDMSGSLVLRSGVGTQMLMVSSSATTAKSVVASSVPAWRGACDVGAGHIGNVGPPSVMALTFRSSRSIPVVWKPALASSTASGRPTYPSPTTPARARRVSIFSSSDAASADIAILLD